MSQFEDRYDPDVAEAMLSATDAAGGLPAYLGIEHVRFEPGRLWCTATIDESLLTPFGNAHGGVGECRDESCRDRTENPDDFLKSRVKGIQGAHLPAFNQHRVDGSHSRLNRRAR